MKKVIELLAIFICFLLQCTLLQHIAFAGIVPNLMVIITSSFGFMEGRSDGMLVGFISGILIDIFYGSVLGLNALIFLFIGYANGTANRNFYPDDIKYPILLISLSDIAYILVTYISGFLLRARFDMGYYFIHLMLPELVYTIIAALIIYFPMQRLVLKVGGFEGEDE